MSAALAASACLLPVLTGSATGDIVTQLQTKLGATRSELNSAKQEEQSLQKSIASLNAQVASLANQINLVKSREAAAQALIAKYQAKAAAAKVAIGHERVHLAHLRNVLAHAVSALKAELVARYEQPQESIVTLVVDANGFQQLIDGLEYLSQAQQREQSIVATTRRAKDQTEAAAARLAALRRSDVTAAGNATTQANALSGMNALLSSRESALADARTAQAAALAATKAQGSRLEDAINTIQKEESAAELAARTVAYNDGNLTSTGWSIPLPIVLCESGGENLPPNNAGASGYYQIIPSTWRDFGGTGPAAYLAPKPEQDAVASRIWNNGAGARNWVCAGIVGIT